MGETCEDCGTEIRPGDATYFNDIVGKTCHSACFDFGGVKALGAEVSRLTEENERLRGLVRSAYNEGFTEGIREYRTDSGGKPWDESRARSALSKGEG